MPKTTAKEWDEVRAAFASSIMANTAISSLAQSLDGPDWPMKGKDETPAKYIDLGFDEMQEMLALKGQPQERVDQLVTILRGTLAFDNPFGDMVEQAAAASAKDNAMLKNMSRLGIPEDFPISLTALGPDAREFCQSEKLTTLGAFALFAQNMSQNVIVGGDFRKLLNALSNVDEKSIAETLPFRPGQKGLHLVEAVGQAAQSRNPAERTAEAVAYFKPEFEALKADLSAGGSLQRHLMVLGNPPVEAKAAELLKVHIGKLAPPPGEKKAGLFGRLFGKS